MNSKYIIVLVLIAAAIGGCSIMMTRTKPKIWTEVSQESTQLPLEVQGIIPGWLQGTLVRNGPVWVSVNGELPSHWFDGLGMLHAFSFDVGQVKYSNKFLHSEAYQTVFDDGSIHYTGFASDPCRSVFRKLLTYFIPGRPPIHNANVNVDRYAGEYIAQTEIPLPVRFEVKTLDTLGVFDYADKLPKERCFESAHPHHDPLTKEIINYIVDFGRYSYYLIYRMAADSHSRELLAQLPVDYPAYMHSFAVTDNYVILVEYPLIVNPIDLITGKGFIQNYRWQPERGTFFRVVSRKNGQEIGRFRGDPFFAFHHVNAFEQDDLIVMDIVTYPDASVITSIADKGEKDSDDQATGQSIRLQRFTLSLPTGRIAIETIAHRPMEFPRVNDAYEGKPYLYAYTTDPRDPQHSDDLRPIYKFNMTTKAAQSWSEVGSYPGEPIFVATPNAKSEDDGIVLAIVTQPQSKQSFLLILDAQSMREIGRASAPYFIPAGLHGRFFN